MTTSLSMLFLDLDKFKFLNDHYGHEYGDELLKALARRLANATRTSDYVARLGDDEFVALLEGERRLKIMDGMIDLVHNLGLKLVCEGIETQPTLDYLRKKGFSTNLLKVF